METSKVKGIAKTEVKAHEKRMHQGMKPTKLAKGGVTGKAMRAMGRNMARAANQRGG